MTIVNTASVLIAAVGTLLGGVGAVLGVLKQGGRARRRRAAQPGAGGPGTPRLADLDNAHIWAACAAVFALAAIAVAATVTAKSSVPHGPPLDSPAQLPLRWGAEGFGLLATFTGSRIVVARDQDRLIADIGGLGLLTGIAVLAGLALIA